MRATSILPDPGVRPAAARTQARRTLAILFLVCLAPVLASYLAFYVWRPQGSVAHGELIQPPMEMYWNSADPAFAALRGKWVLALVSAAACAEPCATLLYQTRQIRTALDKDMPRVGRAWLVDGAAPSPALLAQHPGLQVLPTPSAISTTDFRDRILLIDPQGRLMMRFAPTLDAKLVLKDLQRLLKYSPAGRRE